MPDDIDRVEVENVGERHELDDLDPALTALQHHIASLGCPDGAELLFLAVVTGVAALAAACSLDAPMFSLRKEDWTPEPTSWQKWIFVIWTLAGPLYLLWGWHSYQSNPHPPDFAKFQYGQKLLGELWSAGAVMFGVFWGSRNCADQRTAPRLKEYGMRKRHAIAIAAALALLGQQSALAQQDPSASAMIESCRDGVASESR